MDCILPTREVGRQAANSKQQTIDFNEYRQLDSLKKLNGSRLAELAILKHLKDLTFTQTNITQQYSEKEHQELWNKTLTCLNQNRNTNRFLLDLRQFLTQFSPNDNQYSIHNVNHLSYYVHTALEFNRLLKTPKSLNLIELGANQGLISKTLQLLGHNVLCSDLHHGIVTDSITSYKIGTWLRENFMGLHAVDTFKFNEDSISNLRIFSSGIDGILMRGTGILNLWSGNQAQSDHVFNNLKNLLSILNENGIIFAKHENIYFGPSPDVRIQKIERLKKDLADSCSIDYKIETAQYSNPGWEPFNITLVCRKHAA